MKIIANLAIALAGLALAPAAEAQLNSCTVREFAQYQADAKSASGRITLAFKACHDERIGAQYRSGSRIYDQCDAEATKARDALTAAKQYKWLDFIRAECQGGAPPPAK